MEVAPFQPAIMEVLSLSPTQNLTEKTLSHREAAGHHLSFWQILDANLPTKHRTIETKMQHNVKYVNHGPPKPTFLEAFMVNNLVFRWPKPLFFMVLGAHGRDAALHDLPRPVVSSTIDHRCNASHET